MELFPNSTTFYEANASCISNGKVLVKDLDESIHSKIIALIIGQGHTDANFWIDAYLTKDKKRWLTSDGDDLTNSSLWAPGEPKGPGRCIQLRASKGHAWDVGLCTVSKMYICASAGVENVDPTIVVPSPSSTSDSFIISQSIDRIYDNILQAIEKNSTLNERIRLAEGIFNDIQDIIDNVLPFVSEDIDLSKPGDFTETLMAIVDSLGMFMLEKMTSGSGAIVLQTSSLVLNVEKNSIQSLCDSTVMVDPGSGLEIPTRKYIFPYLRENVTVNRMIFLLKADVQQILNMTEQFTTDILTLAFKNEDGEEIKVQNATKEIGIWLGYRRKSLNKTMVIGQYVEADATTQYMFETMAPKPYHAIQIVLETYEHVYENTTAHVSTGLPGNGSRDGGVTFSREVIFNGSIANIFLPENKITRTGSYYVTFDLTNSHGVEFHVTTTLHRCSYSVDNTNSWQSSGCKVSPKSNVNSTVCLCNHLTTFTAV
ncbi:polycystin-1-like protein 2 isoform X2 [Ptychodera flava]